MRSVSKNHEKGAQKFTPFPVTWEIIRLVNKIAILNNEERNHHFESRSQNANFACNFNPEETNIINYS